MSFKLEYLSAGRNQPCAFTVSVNPLILFRLSLAFLFERWLTPFPRHSRRSVLVPSNPLTFPFSTMKKKELPPDQGSHFPSLTINPWLFFTLLIIGVHFTTFGSRI